MSEQKCVLSQCCCGCSLKSGSLAIGITTLIFGILRVVMGIYNGVNGFNEGWAAMVVGLISVILSAVLIQGIRQEKRSMVMIWVWVHMIVIAINIILGVVGIIASGNLIAGIFLFVVMGIAIYLLLVVRSYAISLGSGSAGMA